VVTLLGLLGVLAVLFGTAVLATRSDPLLAEAPPDRPDLELPDPPLAAADLERVRFSMAVRGYRMSEVDAVLDRLAAELADRDRRLAELGAPPSRTGSSSRTGVAAAR
jgi:DivIVA domain-containing protein